MKIKTNLKLLSELFAATYTISFKYEVLLAAASYLQQQIRSVLSLKLYHQHIPGTCHKLTQAFYSNCIDFEKNNHHMLIYTGGRIPRHLYLNCPQKPYNNQVRSLANDFFLSYNNVSGYFITI